MSSRGLKTRKSSSERTVRRQSRSRERSKSASKSPSRRKSSARGAKVYTKRELSAKSGKEDFTRVTRSKTTQEESKRQKSIERLKKEITDLTSSEKLMATLEKKINAATAEIEEKVRKRQVKDTEQKTEREPPQAKAAKANVDKYKYSGYLRYTNRSVFSILIATLLVIVLFVIISRTTLNGSSIWQQVQNFVKKLLK